MHWIVSVKLVCLFSFIRLVLANSKNDILTLCFKRAEKSRKKSKSVFSHKLARSQPRLQERASGDVASI